VIAIPAVGCSCIMNRWSNSETPGAGFGSTIIRVEPELYIHGEGKTVSFDGVVFLECDTDLDPIWKTASVWDAQPADLVMIAETVPAEVMDNARTVFCPR
jgi:hypothetical protein